MNKKDFSKNCLAQALIELMEDHAYDDISIQDIVDKAGFSRMAYYRNFKNKGEMINYALDTMFDSFIKESDLSYQRMGPEKFFCTLFSFLASEQTIKLSKLLMKQHLTGHLYVQFMKRVQGGFLPNQSRYFYDFMGGGFFSVYVSWIQDGLRETPEQMTAEMMKFVYLHSKMLDSNNS